MPNYPQSTQNILVAEKLGIRVDKATATLAQSGTLDCFTVTGGDVLVTALVGTVTTIIQAQADNMKFISHPATGTDVDMCAVVDVTGIEVNGSVSLPAAVGTALIKATAGGVSMPAIASGFVVKSGCTIRQSCGSSNTGAMKHSLWYLPLDAGASVAAA
jgi:hypothetical protein